MVTFAISPTYSFPYLVSLQIPDYNLNNFLQAHAIIMKQKKVNQSCKRDPFLEEMTKL